MASLTNNGPHLFRREQGSPSTTSTVHVVATASSTPSSNDNNQGLSVTGSPPLIVAFLAVGLFLAAMLTIFGWRRVAFGRGFATHPIGRGGFHAEMKTESFGRRPELWDLWTQPCSDSKEQLEWDRMLASRSTLSLI
jgi:hypothetical protein